MAHGLDEVPVNILKSKFLDGNPETIWLGRWILDEKIKSNFSQKENGKIVTHLAQRIRWEAVDGTSIGSAVKGEIFQTKPRMDHHFVCKSRHQSLTRVTGIFHGDDNYSGGLVGAIVNISMEEKREKEFLLINLSNLCHPFSKQIV